MQFHAAMIFFQKDNSDFHNGLIFAKIQNLKEHVNRALRLGNGVRNGEENGVQNGVQNISKNLLSGDSTFSCYKENESMPNERRVLGLDRPETTTRMATTTMTTKTKNGKDDGNTRQRQQQKGGKKEI